MKRLIAMTAVFCILASLTGCASKSRRNNTIETQDPASLEATTIEETTETTTESEEPEEGTLEFDEELDDNLIGTWKYCYEDDLDAYYIIDSDHSMMSMIDLSDLMFIKNGKLVLGEDDPSNTFAFKEKNDHLIAKVGENVLLDIKPKESADKEDVQGDFDVFDSIILPQEDPDQEESETDDEDDSDEEKSRSIIRFQDKKTFLIELGVCYSTDGQLIFLTNEKRLVLDYQYDEENPDTLVITDGEQNVIKLERSDALESSDADEDDDD